MMQDKYKYLNLTNKKPVLSATTWYKRGKTRHEEVETGEGNLWDKYKYKYKCMLRKELWEGNLFFSHVVIINIETNHIDWQLPKICIQLSGESENNLVYKLDDIFEEIWAEIF